MIPGQFGYHRPATVADAVQLLARLGDEARPLAADSATPGRLVDTSTGPAVATGDGLLELLVVQPAGKRPIAAADWRRGVRGAGEARFGS